VRPFSTSVLEVSGQTPRAYTPVAFDGHVSEAQLETWVVESPQLVGEALLVLGRQLAEFAEDQDRLDVLAVDEDGELVLIELKVAENFKVTDLQALAYAGAYASREPAELANTLRRTLEKSTGTEASLEDAKQRIIEYLELDDFGAWQPSQHVRIKLVAPVFPRRVLKTVKWLGDVYSMPIEAIAVRLFNQDDRRYSLTFERLLPLPEEGEFDMTVRRREERKRSENVARRLALVPLLGREGLLTDGQQLWVSKGVLRQEDRHLYDTEAPAFQVVVRIEGNSAPKFEWRANDEEDSELLSPSAIPYRVNKAVVAWDGEPYYSPVASNFTVTPDGQTLEEFAAANGLWAASENE
jgi:hypothetical protein